MYDTRDAWLVGIESLINPCVYGDLEAKKHANQNQAKPATENPNGVHQGHRLHQMRVQKVCADPLRWERHLRPLWTIPNPVGCLLMNRHWMTFSVFTVPTEDNPVETLNDDLKTTTKHTSVRSYLKHRRQRAPHMQFKSIRYPPTGMCSAVVEIKWRLNPDFIRREANR